MGCEARGGERRRRGGWCELRGGEGEGGDWGKNEDNFGEGKRGGYLGGDGDFEWEEGIISWEGEGGEGGLLLT